VIFPPDGRLSKATLHYFTHRLKTTRSDRNRPLNRIFFEFDFLTCVSIDHVGTMSGYGITSSHTISFFFGDTFQSFDLFEPVDLGISVAN